MEISEAVEEETQLIWCGHVKRIEYQEWLCSTSQLEKRKTKKNMVRWNKRGNGVKNRESGF